MSINARFFVGGLPVDSTPAELKSCFDAYGLVSGANVRKKGGVAFGFVNVGLNSEAAAAKVVNSLNNSVLRGQRLKVERANDGPAERKRPATFEALAPLLQQQQQQQPPAPDAKRQRTEPPAVVAAPAPPEPRKSVLRDGPSKAAKSKRVAFAAAEPADGDAKETKAAKRKKAPKSSKAATVAVAGERERKVREVPVAAVAKATAWDTVLGHAWEDTGERSQFSLLDSLGVADAAPDVSAHAEYQPVATRYARNKMERATGTEAIKALQQKMQQRRTAEGAAAAEATAADTADSAADFGLLFVSQKDSLQEQAKQWMQGMATMRMDFKKKRKRALKRGKTRGR